MEESRTREQAISFRHINKAEAKKDIQKLRRVKIHFDNRQEEEKGFYKLMISGIPINALDSGQYLVNTRQRKILKDNHIDYEVDY